MIFRKETLWRAAAFAAFVVVEASLEDHAFADVPTSPATLDALSAIGIRKVGPYAYEIDRAAVDKIVERKDELARVRAIPEHVNGRYVGLRLFGIRPDSLVASLGVENGDRIESINGIDVSSTKQALEAYARVRSADKISVQLTRKGLSLNLDYDVK